MGRALPRLLTSQMRMQWRSRAAWVAASSGLLAQACTARCPRRQTARSHSFPSLQHGDRQPVHGAVAVNALLAVLRHQHQSAPDRPAARPAAPARTASVFWAAEWVSWALNQPYIVQQLGNACCILGQRRADQIGAAFIWAMVHCTSASRNRASNGAEGRNVGEQAVDLIQSGQLHHVAWRLNLLWSAASQTSRDWPMMVWATLTSRRSKSRRLPSDSMGRDADHGNVLELPAKVRPPRRQCRGRVCATTPPATMTSQSALLLGWLQREGCW